MGSHTDGKRPLTAAPRARRNAVQAAVVVAAWIATTALFIEPLQTILLNWDELETGLPTLLWRLTPLLLSAAVGLAILSGVTCWLAPIRGPALWTLLGVALWIQADVFAWQYGTFDGTPIDWSVHADKAWLELALWLGAPIIALRYAQWIARNALRIVGSIVLLQAVGLASTVVENSPLAEKPSLATTASARSQEFATFSSQPNAVVILVDMVQSDIFNEAMQVGALADSFPEGFVYFRNAASLYISTQFSAQSILTSRAVPDGVDALKWLRTAMLESLPVRLAEQGYDAAIASIVLHTVACERGIPGISCKTLASIASPNIEWTIESTWRKEVNLLVHLALFRLAPHNVKPRVYDAGIWQFPAPYPLRERPGFAPGVHHKTRTDLKALDALAASVQRDDGPPRFRFLHLFGAHFPANIDANCKDPVTGGLRKRAVSTTLCMMNKLARLFAAFEAQGIYDDMAILVISDHGLPTVDLKPEVAQPPLPPPNPGQKGKVARVSMGVPMFLAKAPKARGPLRVSDRPVSLCDVPATILDMLQVPKELGFVCESVLSPRRRTPRLHFRYPSYDQQKLRPRSRRYFFDFEAFRVDGHSWHGNSWISTKRQDRARRASAP